MQDSPPEIVVGSGFVVGYPGIWANTAITAPHILDNTDTQPLIEALTDTAPSEQSEDDTTTTRRQAKIIKE